MRVLRFLGYDVNSKDFFVIADKINHWEAVEYNGTRGTRITMDNGSEMLTAMPVWEVSEKISATEQQDPPSPP
jgi:hypothetical protein